MLHVQERSYTSKLNQKAKDIQKISYEHLLIVSCISRHSKPLKRQDLHSRIWSHSLLMTAGGVSSAMSEYFIVIAGLLLCLLQLACRRHSLKSVGLLVDFQVASSQGCLAELDDGQWRIFGYVWVFIVIASSPLLLAATCLPETLAFHDCERSEPRKRTSY